MDAERRRQARWVSVLVSAQVGEAISAAELLGEKKADGTEKQDQLAARTRQAERKLKKLEEKREKARLRLGQA